MRTISADFAAACDVTHQLTSRLTVTVPGGEPVELPCLDGTVNSTSGAGARRTASVSLGPQPGREAFELVATPGAIFDIESAIVYGGGQSEAVPVFHGEASQSGGYDISSGEISLNLVDMWQRVERCRFIAPYTVGVSYRPNLVQENILAAIPGSNVFYLVDLGPILPANAGTWEKSRGDFIKDMSKDGAFDAYFGPEAATSFFMRPEPILDPKSPVWTFRTGMVSNIKAASRTRPFDRLYNMVVVRPSNEEQTWTQQVVEVGDPSHPRYKDKIGVSPFFWSSPTITTAGDAKRTGNTILQQILGTTDTVTLTVLSNPALEVGDTVTAFHPATDTDPGFAAALLIDSFRMDLFSGLMTITARTSDIAEVDES